MIYVPSETSSYTRNLQDMRIFGNYPNDGLDINLYTSKEIYNDDIKTYLKNQKEIIDKGESDSSCKDVIKFYKFDQSKINTKKLDRPGLSKGISFIETDKWGIPTNINNFEKLEVS